MSAVFKTNFIFQNKGWLKNHINNILNFYYPRCMDYINGGYFNCFFDDGKICDFRSKSLVGTTRFIYDFSIGSILNINRETYLSAAEHGLKFLEDYFLDKENGGYYWLLNERQPITTTKFAYGHAFVLLASSKAYEAGISWAINIMDYVFNILEEHFWETKYRLYADEISSDWSKTSSYRGQNANMHLCEAMISSYEATSNIKYLKRAEELAKSVTINLASQSDGLIWENYYDNWKINWNYKEKVEDLKEFRADGFVPGHSIEWSKLLLMLYKHLPQKWLIEKAEFLYNTSLKNALDKKYGGIFYTLTPDFHPLDKDKYYWVMAETIGASAFLAFYTKDDYYWNVYDYIFYYCWIFFIDKKHGGWYSKLNRENQRYSNIKSSLSKTDYHPITNCYETIKLLSHNKSLF